MLSVFSLIGQLGESGKNVSELRRMATPLSSVQVWNWVDMCGT